MSRILQSSALALALTAGWVTPVQAAAARQPRVADQLAAMQAQLDRLNARVDTLEGQVVQERARADAAEARTGTAIAEAQAARAEAAKLAAVAAKPAEPPVAVAWKGAPEFTGKDGWSFKPRGRLQVDTGGVDAPGTNTSLGMATELRRAFLGVDGTMPGGM